MRVRLSFPLLLVALLAAVVVGTLGCSQGAYHVSTPVSSEAPKNIILMIGDGMGMGQITAARVRFGELNMQRLHGGGIVTDFPTGSLVTDSAASGTALATGHKTVNGAISMSPSGDMFKTVLEHAEENGMSTGLVVSCSVTHATPAVFAAHVDDRGKDLEIAGQIAASGVDVLFGGGRAFFIPNTETGGARVDGRNLLDLMRDRMAVALTAQEFRELPDEGPMACLYADQHPAPASWRNPALPDLTEKALSVLSEDEDGFFMMVEGSQIDWACHENDEDWLLDELEDFDKTVGVVMDFAERDGETLVVVTADHETGAYAVLGGSLKRGEIESYIFGSEHHSANLIPILTYGPGSERLGGFLDNTDIGRTLIELVSAPR